MAARLIGSLGARAGCGLAWVAMCWMAGCGGSNSAPAPAAPATPAAILSAMSLTFASQTAGTVSAAQTVTLSNTGNGALSVSGISLVGANASSFAETNTCGSSVAAAGSCTISITFSAASGGSFSATVSVADNASGSPQIIALAGTAVAATPAVTLSPSMLTFSNQSIAATSPAQAITVTNSGNAALAISGVSLAPVASSFAETTTCGAALAAAATCTISVTYSPSSLTASSAMVQVADNAGGSPQTVALNGNGVEASIDCSLATALCPGITLNGDTADPSLFHGFADPSMRKDPNAGVIYLAYSYPRTLSDTTLVVDLHLSHSLDDGATWNYDGPLFTSQSYTNTSTMNYAMANQTSTEVVDLLPIAQGGETMWVQAHLNYLVPAGGHVPYAQLTQTNYLSLSTITVAGPSSANTNQLLGLGTAKQTILGNAGTDPTLSPNVNLSLLNPALNRCNHFDQPALWYQSGTLYLAAQCFETAPYDGSELASAVFSTTPSEGDPTTWTWSYVGLFATTAQAAALGVAEGTTYQLFTQLEFVNNRFGQLMALVTPAVTNPTGTQPITQYGCRVIPMASLTEPALQTDANGVPEPTTKVTEDDLYTDGNEGPAACTYEPASSTGVVIVRKLEKDPTYGFYSTLQGSTLQP